MLLLASASILTAVAIGEFYSVWTHWLSLEPWKSLLILHSLLSVVALLTSRSLRRSFALKGRFLWVFFPAALIVGGAFILVILDRRDSIQTEGLEWQFALLSCSLIPIVEEIVFRGVLSPVLTHKNHPVWSMYFSALVFALAHSSPTISRVINLNVGVPIGVFLLGFICQWLYRRTSSLLPAISFHCACNLTVIIFTKYGSDWLRRLSILYT
jgi:membrane protease YdiL (CAAX protease family)